MNLVVPLDRINAFEAWTKERGIEGKPHWILCSNWA